MPISIERIAIVFGDDLDASVIDELRRMRFGDEEIRRMRFGDEEIRRFIDGYDILTGHEMSKVQMIAIADEYSGLVPDKEPECEPAYALRQRNTNPRSYRETRRRGKRR